MDTKTYLPSLLSLTKTKEELLLLEEKLETVSDLIGKVNENQEQRLKEILDYESFAALTEDFQNLNLDSRSQTDLQKYLELLKEKILSLRVLKLTLAIKPSKELTDEIYNFAAQNIGRDVILDLQVDSSLIGGQIIEFEGKYKNYSVKEKLENFFNTNKAILR